MKNSYHVIRLLLRDKGEDRVCLLDSRDLSKIAGYAWIVNRQGYAVGSKDGLPQVLMHRLITESKTGFQVDHINRDKLDNRSCNLREVGHRENMLNKPIRKDNRFGLRGVSSTAEGRFRANITVNKKTYYLGSFDTPEQAAEAYNQAALRLNGKDAQVNTIH